MPARKTTLAKMRIAKISRPLLGRGVADGDDGPREGAKARVRSSTVRRVAAVPERDDRGRSAKVGFGGDNADPAVDPGKMPGTTGAKPHAKHEAHKGDFRMSVMPERYRSLRIRNTRRRRAIPTHQKAYTEQSAR